jgi:uncharacterized RDD family membrane protein YckC
MSQITVLNKSNQPTGPFTRAQVAEKLQSGEFALSDLAFIDGLTEWTPLQQVLAKVDASTISSAPTLTSVAAPAPAAVAPAYSYAATMAPPSHLAYAGFWLRFVAYFIDSIIVGIAMAIPIFVIVFIITLTMGTSLTQMSSGDSQNLNNNPAMFAVIGLVELVVWGLAILVTWLYFAKMESGPGQATFGKRLLGLKVIDMAGQRLSFGRASGRFFGKIVSGLTM